MTAFPLLSLLTFFPLLGAIILVLSYLPRRRGFLSPYGFSLIVSVATFLISLSLFSRFELGQAGFQFVEKIDWIPSWGVSYHRGVDGISMVFILLTTFLFPLALLAASTVKKNSVSFAISLLALESLLIGAFSTLDLVLFYIFFEGSLIPMFLIIGLFGGENKLRAAYKFFLYTFGGSVLMLVAIVGMVWSAGTADMLVLMNSPFPAHLAPWLWLGFFASFAVKTPLWPFHTWLPLAHVEAPTAGSVLLAGLLLKLGGYGFIRLSLQILPEQSAVFAPMMMGLGALSILYASMAALAQTDIKRLVAYSSVAHMGLAIMGIFSGFIEGLFGAMMIMLSHGLISAGLFLGVGVLYERFHTRDMGRFGGLIVRMPGFALVFMLLVLAAIGVPGTSGFVGEFTALQGVYLRHILWAVSAVGGVVLGAVYMLRLYKFLFFGAPKTVPPSDLDGREVILFAPLLVVVLWMGLLPTSFSQIFMPALTQIVGGKL